MAAMSGEWLCRKVRHPWEGGQDRLTMYFATLDSATSKPSLSSSPWIRGAPHSGLSALIRRISARRSASTCGRPPRERDFHRQYRRKPVRCQHDPTAVLHPLAFGRAFSEEAGALGAEGEPCTPFRPGFATSIAAIASSISLPMLGCLALA